MKTSYTQESVSAFLEKLEHANPVSITKLAEGHISQAFGFETESGDSLVLRISNDESGFAADQHAANVLGSSMPVPRVFDINSYDTESFYCISARAMGKTTNLLDEHELALALPDIRQTLANIYLYDVSGTNGYGHIDIKSGNASHDSWKSAVSDKIEMAGVEVYKQNAANLGIAPGLIDKFFAQYRDNLAFASETRRLLHGDPAFDNMLVEGDKVTAVIDWAQMGYGDWVSDFAHLDFWWPGRYGDIKTFATQYNLDNDNLDERIALYWAANALWTIEFADTTKSKSVSAWLKEHLKEKLIQT